MKRRAAAYGLREKGYTYDQIGEALGVTGATASRWINQSAPAHFDFSRPRLKKKMRPTKPVPASPWGVLYFIQSGDEGPVKIGISTDVARRLADLQNANPHPLKILSSRLCEPRTPEEVETELHQRFAGSRLSGEWFRPSDELLALAASPSTPGFVTYELGGVVLERGKGLCARCGVDVYMVEGIHDSVSVDDVPSRCSACIEVDRLDGDHAFRLRDANTREKTSGACDTP